MHLKNALKISEYICKSINKICKNSGIKYGGTDLKKALTILIDPMDNRFSSKKML